MIPADLRANALLKESQKIRRFGVEVGVCTGALSQRILAADPTLYLYLVDPWAEALEGGTYRSTEDTKAQWSQKEHEEAMDVALKAVQPFGGRYKIMRMTSVEAAETFPQKSLDWVFLDGDHSYEAVKADIQAWTPKVRPGGLICGHDYRDEMGFGVIQAVHETLSDKGLRLGLNYTWFVTV